MQRTLFQITLFFVLSLIFSFTAQAQLIDDFSDGDFSSNPTWIGETSFWQVNSGELQSNGTGTDTIYLSTSNSRLLDTEWRFKIRYTGGGPSTSNFLRIYIVSDQSDLEGALNGYFIQVGESGSNDSYDLFRQDGSNAPVKIIDGQDGLGGSAVDATIRLIRDNAGLWELFVDQGNTGFFVSQGSANDNTFTNSSFFGILARHTSTRTQDFFLDNVYVGDVIQDTLPPSLTSLQIVNANTLLLTFDEEIGTASGLLTSNYSIDGGIGNPSTASFNGADQRVIELGFANSFQNNTSYNLSISNLEDTQGNQLNAPIVEAFNFIVPSNASFKDVIINEIMADPSPPQGLPNAEYLELYNRGNGTYNLAGWGIDNGTTIGTLPEYFLLPGEYVILARSSDLSLFQGFGDVIAPSSWPSLVNGGDKLGLRSDLNELIDSVEYELTWYRDAIKDNGGFSLELINPDLLDCAALTNWIASVSTQGGTPGIQNSVFSTAPDANAPKVLDANVLGSDTILLCFDEGMDPGTLSIGTNYSLDNGLGHPAAAIPLAPDNQCVKLVFAGQINVGVAYQLDIQGVTDCSGNAILPIQVPVAKGVQPQMGDLVITELLPDFEPARSLPGSEFVELFNRSSSVLDIAGHAISDGSSTANLPATVIYPGEYVIICAIFDTADWNDFGRVIAVDALPSLNNSSDSIRLIGRFQETLDYVFYDRDWYQNPDKELGGWSLEKIDTDLLDCNNPANWLASVDTRGGTPGTENSVKGTFVDNEAPVLVNVNVARPDQIILTFSEPMDPSGLTEEVNFIINQGLGLVLRAIIASEDNRIVQLDLPSPLVSNTIYELDINKLSDCSGNPFESVVKVGLPENPDPFDLIFTELYPDFTPSRGLPEVEFVELYNRSGKVINTGSLILEVSGSRVNLPQGLIFPAEYVLLVEDGNQDLFDTDGVIVALENLPSLTNGVDSLYLIGPDPNAGFQNIDFTYYTDDWYGNSEAMEGGVSLERLDLDFFECVNQNNWTASVANIGGTPGSENSLNETFSDDLNPTVTALRPLGTNVIELVFSEQLDASTVINTENYTVEPGLGNPLIVESNSPFENKITLTFDSDLVEKTIYRISFQNLIDCSGNAVQEEIEFGLPDEMEAGDILINEILFNPVTRGSDFVELINVSDKILDLSELSIGEIFPDTDSIFNADKVAEKISLILPGQIICLTRDVAFQMELYRPPLTANFLEMTGFPSYDDAKGECIIFRTEDEIPLDRFAYLDDYHYLTLDDDDGVSLERLSLEQATNDPENWQSAASTVGYATPGYQNSQFIPDAEQDAEVLLEPQVFSPNLDGIDDVLAIRYKVDFPGANLRVQIFDANGRPVRILQQNTLLSPDGGVVFWDGFNENNQLAPIGAYVVLVEILNSDTGEKRVFKRVAILADNF
ncbi:MAG: lamin tail domain-containing protein [Bacteroidia bacterium]|nr:lamin tail domain-containing protein [Bacteroidia bacterium]